MRHMDYRMGHASDPKGSMRIDVIAGMSDPSALQVPYPTTLPCNAKQGARLRRHPAYERFTRSQIYLRCSALSLSRRFNAFR